MKTLIVFLLSTANYILVNARFPGLEVFELRESAKDNQLYVPNDNDQYDGSNSKLVKLFKRYKKKKTADRHKQKAANGLVEFDKSGAFRAEDDGSALFILGGHLFGQTSDEHFVENSDQHEEFVDQTRKEKPEWFRHRSAQLIPGKRNKNVAFRVLSD